MTSVWSEPLPLESIDRVMPWRGSNRVRRGFAGALYGTLPCVRGDIILILRPPGSCILNPRFVNPES
jgi:hypothetical protein